jgi:hypothetical protein
MRHAAVAAALPLVRAGGRPQAMLLMWLVLLLVVLVVVLLGSPARQVAGAQLHWCVGGGVRGVRGRGACATCVRSGVSACRDNRMLIHAGALEC